MREEEGVKCESRWGGGKEGEKLQKRQRKRGNKGKVKVKRRQKENGRIEDRRQRR